MTRSPPSCAAPCAGTARRELCSSAWRGSAARCSSATRSPGPPAVPGALVRVRARLTALYLVLIPFICVAEGCGDLGCRYSGCGGAQAAAVLLALWAGLLRGDRIARRLAGRRRAGRRGGGVARSTASGTPARTPIAPRLRDERTCRGSGTLPARAGSQRTALARPLLTYQSLVPILLYLRGGTNRGNSASRWPSRSHRSPSWRGCTAISASGARCRADDRFDQLRGGRPARPPWCSRARPPDGRRMLASMVAPVFASRFLPLTSLVALFVAGLGSLLLQAMAGGCERSATSSSPPRSSAGRWRWFSSARWPPHWTASGADDAGICRRHAWRRAADCRCALPPGAATATGLTARRQPPAAGMPYATASNPGVRVRPQMQRIAGAERPDP